MSRLNANYFLNKEESSETSSFFDLTKSSIFNANEEQGEIATQKKTETKRPRRYKVLLHNDDFTTMEFVVHILKKFFNKSYAEAEAIMLEIHNKGTGTCGIFTKEVAEMKSNQVIVYSEEKGHPLKSSIEPE